MIEFLKNAYHFLSDVRSLIQWGGTLLVCIIVFVETGLFFGFFLPGDSLLVTAGVLAAGGFMNLTSLLILVSLCAVVGDQLGYAIGRKAGQALYKRQDSLFFKKRHLERAHDFYEKYGGKTIVLARFVPIVRTFSAPVAGAARMNYRRFLSIDIFGGILWVWSMVLIGYSLGSAIPNVDEHIHIVIAVVVFLSILPGIIGALKHRRQNVKEALAVHSGDEKAG
ncbi:MAG TPA: VTT domain-containing protein [Acidobacteriota bacterium]|nr:VTT domain-containing protein [Acidobacteriota bacterium]